MDKNLVKNLTIVWDWLAITDVVEPVDVIFVFGGAMMEIPQKALELLQKDISHRVIFNGNTGYFSNPEWKKPEADMFADYVLEHGIESHKVMIQNTSTNTLLDVQYGLETLEKNNIDMTSVILISRPVHQRRAFATFKKVAIPGLKIINQPCDEKFPENSEDLKTIATRCVAEYDRLIEYGQKGDIESQEIPENISKAVEELRLWTK